MKRYKLIKDLPTFKAGDEFHLIENGDLVLSDGDAYKVVYHHKELEKFPSILKDWFEEIPEGYKRWRAEEGGDYYCWVPVRGACHRIEHGNSMDDVFYSIGNYFRTEEEAEKYGDYLIALQIIKDDAKGFVPDWKNDNQLKYCGFYHYVKNVFIYDYGCSVQVQGAIYFKTKEDIEESFKKHRKEWLTVLGVEEC